MSRAGRIARGLTVGYGYQATVALTGLALTPFLLGRLGTDDFGRWLVVGQMLGLLGLLDLGVTAVLPREVARASAAGNADVGDVVSRARWLVWFQTPLAAVVAVVLWASIGSERPELSVPLAVILATYVVVFPLRIPAAVLTGLQELSTCGAIQAGGWVVTTLGTITLVLAGWGLQALAVSWAVGQLVACGAAWYRLRKLHPSARGGWRWPGFAALIGLLGPSLWLSLAQVSQVLVAGTDLLVAGWVLGPAAVVAYGCTTKLVSVTNNACYAIGLAAQPALAQLRASSDRGRLISALRAAGLAVLAASGAVVVVVAAVNEPFVGRWVGAERYAGPAVTTLALAAMTIRHVAFGWWSAAYVLGRERALCLVLAADGIVTVAATAGWAAAIGPAGVPLGSLTGAVLVYMPTGLFTLANVAGVRPRTVLGWVAPWAVRFGVVIVPVLAVGQTLADAAPAQSVALAAGGLAVYAALIWQLASHEPLKGYRDRGVAAILKKFRRPRVVEGGCDVRAER